MFKQFIKKVIYTFLSPFLKNCGPEHSIYITFDDGPHPVHTLEILEILRNYKVHATFFYNGELIEKYPDIVFRVKDEGHQIGYHSYFHKSLKKETFSSIYRDLQTGKKLLTDLGMQELLYRPPYGDISLVSLFLLFTGGWKIVMWNVESRDSFDTEEEILQNLEVNNIPKGAIILLHDVYEKTPRILPTVLQNLIQSNLMPGKLTYK